MAESLSKDKLERFDAIARSLSTAIKNVSLYPPGHPNLENSLAACFTALEVWLTEEDRITIGITQDNLLCSGTVVREKSELFASVADFLHQRGVIAFSCLRGVERDELTQFFSSLKGEPKAIAERGGVLKNMSAAAHIIVKEVDYSQLLGSARLAVTKEESDYWLSLTSISEESRRGELPASKLEFVREFISDSKRSATVLNKIYRQAQTKLDEDSASGNIRQTISRIADYFSKYSSEESGSARKGILDVISRLDPKLVVKLFEKAEVEGKTIDLPEELLTGFSDDMIADFFSSLITGEESLNENTLKLFDKLAPEQGKANALGSLVADKLLQIPDKRLLADVRTSIQKMFKANPENDFLSQFYKLTLGAFAGGSMTGEGVLPQYAALVKEFEDFATGEGITKSYIRLLLNIIWFTDEASLLKKFLSILEAVLAAHCTKDFLRSYRDTVELCCDKLKLEQKTNVPFQEEMKEGLSKIFSEPAVRTIISFIPSADPDEMKEIEFITSHFQRFFISPLLEGFISEHDRIVRNKYLAILTMMGIDAGEPITLAFARVSADNIEMMSDLFDLLKKIDARAAERVAKSLMNHQDVSVRLSFMDMCQSVDGADLVGIFDALSKENDPENAQKIIRFLLRTRNSESVNGLFSLLEKGPLRKRYFLLLLKLCGDLQVAESVPALGGVISKRPFFCTKAVDDLRVAAAVSLGQIATDPARELVRTCLKDKSSVLRRMCSLILEMEKVPASNGSQQ